MAIKRATDNLNVALSQVTAGIVVMESIIEGMGAPNKAALTAAITQMKLGADKAFDNLRMIRNAAESI